MVIRSELMVIRSELDTKAIFYIWYSINGRKVKWFYRAHLILLNTTRAKVAIVFNLLPYIIRTIYNGFKQLETRQ